MRFTEKFALLSLLLLEAGIQVRGCKSKPKPKPPPKDLLYLGHNALVELPTFKRFPNCTQSVSTGHYPVTFLVKGNVMICGGDTIFDKITNECRKIENGAWTFYPEMNSTRFNAATSSAIDGKVMVTGGANNDGEVLNSTEIYNIEENKWEEGTPLPVKMFTHCQVSSKSGIVVAGLQYIKKGNKRWYEDDDMQHFLVYRLVKGVWEKLADMDWANRQGPTCELLSNERLAVLGGSGYDANFDILDLKSLNWSKGPKLPVYLFKYDYSVLYKDILYIIHQETGYVYSITQNLTEGWKEVTSLGQLPGMISRRRVHPALIVKEDKLC